MARFAALALLLLTGCTNTTDKMVTDDACLKSETRLRTTIMVVSCGNHCFRSQPIIQPYQHCLQHLHVVYPNPDYKDP